MLYVYLCCGRDEKKGVRRLGRNMLYGLFWGAGLSALCTNVVVVSLFWLNACFTSADKTCDYRIIAAKVHDRRPKSRFFALFRFLAAEYLFVWRTVCGRRPVHMCQCVAPHGTAV